MKKATVDELLTVLGYPGYDLRQEAIDHQHPGYVRVQSDEGAPLRLERSSTAPSAAPLDLGSVILAVEMALAISVEGSKHLDEIPRPADYLNAFGQLQKDALLLLSSIGGMGGYYRDQFALHGAAIHDIEIAIGSILDVCAGVEKNMKGQPSKGARTDRAKMITVKELLRIYRSNAKPPATIGGELEFVRIALQDARIEKPLPPNPDFPIEQRQIDFAKKIRRYILQADKSDIQPPRRIG